MPEYNMTNINKGKSLMESILKKLEFKVYYSFNGSKGDKFEIKEINGLDVTMCVSPEPTDFLKKMFNRSCKMNGVLVNEEILIQMTASDSMKIMDVISSQINDINI